MTAPRSVLIVEDEILIGMLTSDALEDAGFRVFLAGDGREALELLTRELPDAIVSDYMMPRLDGLGLAVAVKADPKLRNIPILLTSAVPGNVMERHPGLFAAFLQKPYDLGVLIATVSGLIGGG